MCIGLGFLQLPARWLFFSPRIFSIYFGSDNLQRQSLRGHPCAMVQLQRVTVPTKGGNLDRIGAQTVPVLSGPRRLFVKWEWISWLWHSEQCTLLLHTPWTLSKGAVNRQKRGGKYHWSTFAFLPTEGFESLSPSAGSGNDAAGGNWGCLCAVKMALWMLCRVQPMVLHAAHFPGQAHWNTG